MPAAKRLISAGLERGRPCSRWTPRAVARMSCNPSIGGMAKSHIVFDLDALGGEMARNTDCTGDPVPGAEHEEGPSRQANRAQCDRRLLRPHGGRIGDDGKPDRCRGDGREALVSGRLAGVVTMDGVTVRGRAVVLTAGTFLNGTIHIGRRAFRAGAWARSSSTDLGSALRDMDSRAGRLKTGTPGSTGTAWITPKWRLSLSLSLHRSSP